MDDTTTPMHIIQPEQNLLCYLLDQMHGNTLILMPLDQSEQIFAKHLENHADVSTVRAFVAEMVQE